MSPTIRRRHHPARLTGVVVAGLLFVVFNVSGSSLGTASGFGTSLSATPAAGPVPLLVGFSVTVLSGSATWYNWTFGDGTYLNGTATSDAAPYHRYDLVGLFNASVTVHEGNLLSDSSLLIHVYAAPLAASIAANPPSGVAPLTVEFVGTASGGTGTYSFLNWSFGDGGVGSGLTLRYEFLHSGNFRVDFNVTDTAGTTFASTAWVNVSSPPTVPSTKTSSSPSVLPWVAGGFIAGLAVAVGALLALGRRPRPVAGPAGPTEPEGPTIVGESGTQPTPSPAPASVDVPVASVPTPAVPVATVSAPRGAPVERTSREVLRLSQRIVIHLSELGRLGPDDVAPVGFSQLGMAERLQVKQNALTNVLRRLVAAGVLSEDVRHVRGRPRRLKVYRLTGRGEALARDLRRPSPGGWPSTRAR